MSQRYEQRPEERDQDGASPDELHWPGKRTKVDAAMKNAPADPASNESDPRRPDIARIRSAVGKLGSGKPLPETTQADLGGKLGIDLSAVKLHENNAGAQELGAQGFTHADHIALAPGVDVSSDAGQHILAHELVHVAQNQAAGGAAMEFAARLDIGPSDSPTEREAEAGASALTSGRSFRASGGANLPGISLFEGPTPTPTGKKPGEFAPNDPQNPDYDPSKDPSVTSQVPPPVKTDTPKPAPPPPAPKPAAKEPPKDATPKPPAAKAPPSIGPKKQGPSIGPAPKPVPKAASPTQNLDERVKLELEKRKDPAIGTAYESVTAQVDVLKIQALQFSFQESGFFNSVVSSLLPYESVIQHAKQISATNPYDAGTWQARIDGLRGVIRILSDIAGWVATIADIVAAVAGLIALITSITGVGAVIGGAVALVAAEIGTIAGLVKIVLDLIDALLGILQMYLTIKKIKALKKGSPERVKLAALLGKEVKDVSATLTGVVVQVGTIVITAGAAAGLSKAMGKGGFFKNFAEELGKEFRPILPKKALAKLGVKETSKEVIQGGINDFKAGRAAGKAAPKEVAGDQISDKAIADRVVTAKRIDTERQLIKSKKPRRKRGKREFRDVIVHSSNKPVLRRADLKVPKSNGPITREVRFFVDEAKLKRGIPTLDQRVGVRTDQSAVVVGQTANAGTNESKDSNRGEPGSANKPTADAPGTGAAPGTSPFTKVQMWPSQVEKLKATRAELPAANSHLMSQYENAKGAAGKHQSGQLEKLYGGVRNAAGQMRLTALAEEKEAGQSAGENKQGAETAKKGGETQGKAHGEQAKMDASGQKLGGAKVETPPPKEGGGLWERAKNWVYNQTIGRLGNAINGMQSWMQKTIGGIVMGSSGLTKEECDMAGIENSMRADEQKDKEAEAQNKQTAADANKIDPALAEIMKGANADEQHALQAMLQSQEMATAIDAAMKQLDEAITAGTEYINEVSPVIRHELETKTDGKAIDAAYVAPAINGANAVKTAVAGDTDADADAQIAKDELALALSFWPGLNIGPGNAQIDAAKGKFVAAHGKAVADAQAAADGAIGQLNGLIGSTNYNGVSAIATQLDSAVESFLATEGKLIGDYIGQLEAVLDAYIELIQSAVTQEEVALPAGEEPVQRKADGSGGANDADAGNIAARGTAGDGGKLPHGDAIQQSFGRHDVSGVQAHVGGDAADASQQLGAKAYAQGNKVAFAKAPDLHTAAHEAAHVVQQRSGVSLKAIDGGAGDAHEQHADAVADAVVSGKSAEPLLDGAAGANAPGVQRKEDAPQPPNDKGVKDPKDEKKKDPNQAAADKAAAKPKKAAGTGEPDEDAKKDLKKDGKEGKDDGKGDKAAGGEGKGASKKDDKKAAAPADPKAAAKPADAAGGPPAAKTPVPLAPKVLQPADVAQPLPVAPVQPLRLAAPTTNKQLDDQWIKDTGRTAVAHHAQITGELDALTAEITAKQNELMTLADQEATKITGDLQGKVANFSTAIIAPGRARVEAAFGSMTKTLDQAETKAKTDISVAKIQGTQKIALAHTATDASIQTKFTTAKSGNDALVKKTAPAATAVIKKFAGTIKPFIDKAKQSAVTATTTISNDPQYDPAQGDAASGMAGGTKSLRADTYKSAILAHGKSLGADYEAKLSGIGKDVERKANDIVTKALEPAKQELDIALEVVSASAKKNLEAAKTTATTQLDGQEKSSLEAVTKAKAGGQQKWVAEKATSIETADKAGKEFTDNASAAGTELTSRIKKRASEDAKNYGALATEIQTGLKGGPRKYEDVAPKIADAKARLASGHATNVDGLRKLATTGATELGVTLGKHQGVYQEAIKTQEGQAKIVEAAIVKDVTKGATDMTGSLTGLAKGFDETVTKEAGKIDGAVAQFNANAQAALADFDKKVSDQLEQIRTGLDQKLQEDLVPDAVLKKATPVADKNFKAKQKSLSKDAGTLRTAMDGWGTDEGAIWGVLRKCSWGEIEFLESTYDSHYDNRGKDGLKPLRYDLQDEMSGSDLQIALSYLNHDRKEAIKLELKDSTGFFNDDEKRIEEVLRGASEEEIKHLNTDPASIKVVADVKAALGGADLDVVNTLLDQNMAREDRATKSNAIRLFEAMDGWGTDEATVKSKLEEADTPGERARLRAAFNSYAATKEWPQGSGAEGDDALDLALKGDMSGGELVVAQTLAKTERDEKDVKVAKLIEAADGGGTDEDAMIDALDDDEYATKWKALKEAAKTGDGEAVKKLQELEAERKRDLDGRLDKMGESGGIQKLIDGESEKAYITYDELLAGQRKDGKPVTANDKAFLKDMGSGYLEWMVMQRKLQTGQAEPELLLAYACWGVSGTHEDLVNKALSNGGEPKPLSKVKEIAADFQRVWGTALVDTWEIDNPQPNAPDDGIKFPDPGGLLSAELGGKDWLKTRTLLCGEPTTAPQIRYVTKLQAHYAKSGLIGGVLMDVGEAVGFTEAKSTMQHSENKFDNKYAQLRVKFGDKLSTTEIAQMGEDGEQLQLLSEYLQQDIEAYNKALSSIVDTVVTVLEIVGGIIVTVLTAGTASPILAAIIGNLIVSAGTIAFKAAAYGAQYGAGDLAKDVVQAAVTAGFAGLGEVKALKTLTDNAGKATTGALFKTVNDGVNKGGGRLIGTTIEMGPKAIESIQKVVSEGTKNLILSSGQEIANTLTDEKTYDLKLGEALWGENSIGARLLKNAPKAFAEGAVKQMIDDVANVSNKDNQGGHKSPMANMFANMMSDAGANVAGFFVYVDNYQDAGTFWDELLKSTGKKAASGFFQGYGMHKQRAKKSGRDFINGEIGVDGLREMLSYLDAREVRDLADFVQKYGGDKFHQLPDEFKKAVGAPQPVAAPTTPAAKPTQPTQAQTEPDAIDPDSGGNKKADADAEARRQQKEAADKKAADEAETRRIAAEDDIKRKQEAADAEKARLAKEAKRVADEAQKQKDEALRAAKEADDKRKADEARKVEEARLAKEAEDKRIADEAKKKKDEEERAAKEAEKKRLEQEAEQARQKEAQEKEKRLAEEARLKKEAEEKRLAEEARLKKAAEDKRLADEQAVRDQAFKDKEDAEKLQKQQQMDAAFQQKRDAEAKKKATEVDQMHAQKGALQADADQKKQAATQAQEDKPKTTDQVRTDEDQATKITDQAAKADEQAKPLLKSAGEEDAIKPAADTTKPVVNDPVAPKKADDADQEQKPGEVGSHKGKDVYAPRTQEVDGVQKPVPYSSAELQQGLAPLTSRKQGKVTINNVTEQGASLHMSVSVDGGAPIDVVVALKVSDKLAPSTHGDDGGSARFALDHVDGKWTATIDIAQGLDPRDVRFVIGHELDEIANLVNKNPAGKPKGGLGDEMQASVMQGGFDHGTKATAHDIAGATEIVELYKDWQRLVAEGSPDADRRKQTLDRAIKAQGLDAPTTAKLKLLEDAGAPRQLIDGIGQASAESVAKGPALKIDPGTIPADLPGDRKKLFEDAKALFDRLAASDYHGVEFAKLQWAAFLRESGVIIDGGVTHTGTKEVANTAPADLLNRAPPAPRITAAAGDTVATDSTIGIRSPTLKGTNKEVAEAAFKEVVQTAKGFELEKGFGGNKITVKGEPPITIKLVEPTHLPDGQMAGMKRDGDEIHVWVSDRLPDDQVNRAIGAIIGQAIGSAQGKTGKDLEKQASVGQIDALLARLQKATVENETPAKPLPDTTSAERIDVASQNAKRQSTERIAAELDLLIAKHPNHDEMFEAMGGTDSKLAKDVQAFLASRKQIGFNADAMVDPSKLPAAPKDEESNRPSTVLAPAPTKVQPYSEADHITVLELRVAMETVAEIDARLAQRDQKNTSSRDNPIAAGETLRRRDMVAKVQQLLAKLQLGGTDKAYYEKRLAELEAVFPGVADTIAPKVRTRVEERKQSDEAHGDAKKYRAQAQEQADAIQKTLATSTADKPFITDRIVVGDGPTGLANIAGLGVKAEDNGFVDPKKLLVVGGSDLIAKMADSDPNMRWGQRAEVFDPKKESGEAHPIYRGGGGELQKAAEDSGDFATVGQMSDSMDLARKRMGVARAEATVLRVELRDQHQGDWKVDSHAVRVVLVVNGKEVVVYANHTDITTGLGKAGLPDESILSKADRKKMTEGDNKVIMSGEDAVTGEPMKDLKVLVVGYGPTGAWAAIEAAKRGAKNVDWGGSSGQLSDSDKKSNEAGFSALRGVDRVQETLDPKAKINITTDRILKIEPKGEGALVTYVSGTPPKATTYYVQYDRVISAMMPIPSATATNVPSDEVNAGTMVGGVPLAPQKGTEAPVWSSENDTVRVMGPAAEGIKGATDKEDKTMTDRRNAIPRSADSPDHRVMEATGDAADLANKVK